MNQLELTNMKYHIQKNLRGRSYSSIEIYMVSDKIGADIDSALRKLIVETEHDEDIFSQLISKVKILRWHALTSIQPRKYNPKIDDCLDLVLAEAAHLFPGVDSSFHECIQALTTTCKSAQDCDSPLGDLLIDSIREIGDESCLVLTQRGSLREEVSNWLADFNVAAKVAVPGELVRIDHEIEQIYVVGPPVLFPASILYSSISSSLAFIMPSWFRDTALPKSHFDAQSEGGGNFKTTIRHIGIVDSNVTVTNQEAFEERDMLPQPHRGAWDRENLQSCHDQVKARRLLLSRGYMCFLNDDEQYVRSFEPTESPNSRLVNISPGSIGVGTYVVIRKNQSGSCILYLNALKNLRSDREAVIASQTKWKTKLKERLAEEGSLAVQSELAELGVTAFKQVSEWLDPSLSRPKHLRDFKLLLEYLNLEEKPYYTNANRLYDERISIGQTVRHQLEEELEHLDDKSISQLILNGYMELSSDQPDIRNLIVAKIIAIGPYEDISRQETQKLLKQPDNDWQWFE